MKAKAKQANFGDAMLVYALFDHADLELANFTGADLRQTKLHAVRDTATKFDSNVKKAIRTDVDRLEAEAWKPKR
jgi:uncharacterized protein YjbI with pentapeptide repeats